MIKNIVFRKDPLVIGAIEFKWRDGLVFGCVARFDKEINIQGIWSKHQNMGNCQEFIKLFKKDIEKNGLTLVSSVPISSAWRHICEKFKIKIYE